MSVEDKDTNGQGPSVFRAMTDMIVLVVGHVLSRLTGNTIKDQLHILHVATPFVRLLYCAGVMLGLFGLAVLASSFGWQGLAVYFVAAVVLFY